MVTTHSKCSTTTKKTNRARANKRKKKTRNNYYDGILFWLIANKSWSPLPIDWECLKRAADKAQITSIVGFVLIYRWHRKCTAHFLSKGNLFIFVEIHRMNYILKHIIDTFRHTGYSSCQLKKYKWLQESLKLSIAKEFIRIRLQKKPTHSKCEPEQKNGSKVSTKRRANLKSYVR